MAADDVLWKNVEEMKAGRSLAHKQGPTPSEPAQKPSPAVDKASPSSANGSTLSTRETEPSSSTAAHGAVIAADNPERAAKPDQADRTNGRTDDRPSGLDARLFGQVPARPAQRRPERYAFQFWADQITRLKKLRQVLNMAKDPDDRSEVALSDLVRTAVDDYLDRETERIHPTDGAR